MTGPRHMDGLAIAQRLHLSWNQEKGYPANSCGVIAAPCKRKARFPANWHLGQPIFGQPDESAFRTFASRVCETDSETPDSR